MTNGDRLEFYTTCKLIANYCPNAYAVAYAKAGLALQGTDAIRCQCLYILSNMASWRGPVASQCRVALKRIGG